MMSTRVTEANNEALSHRTFMAAKSLAPLISEAFHSIKDILFMFL